MRFRVLGSVQLRAPHGFVTVASPRRRTLLAALLVRAGEIVSAEELIDMVWGESPPRTARASLHSHVCRLRATIGRGRGENPLLTLGDGYRLDVEKAELDVGRFETLTRRGRSAAVTDPQSALPRLDEALALWRGPPYADVASAGWVRSERRRLEEVRLVATGARVESCLALGRDADVVAELAAAVTTHPLHEPAYGQLMVALCRGGRRAEALEVYAGCRSVLAEQLGVGPSAALRRLHHEILTQSAPLRSEEEVGDVTDPVERVARLIEVAEADAGHAREALEGIVRSAHGAGDRITEGTALLSYAFVCLRHGPAPRSGRLGSGEDGAVQDALEVLVAARRDRHGRRPSQRRRRGGGRCP